MNAPPLLLLSPGDPAAPAAPTVRRLHAQITQHRPDLDVRTAFVGTEPRDCTSLLGRLDPGRSGEMVLVPLLACDFRLRDSIAAAIGEAGRRRPALRVQVAEPLGSHPLLLDALDVRLRRALRRERVRELDGLVLAASGTRNSLEAQWLGRIARMWASQHRLPVTVGHLSGGSPSVAQAVRLHRQQGHRHIAVGMYVLTADVAPHESPLAGAQRALPGGLAPGGRLPQVLPGGQGDLVVAEPLGALPQVAYAIMARYAAAAIQLLPIPA